MSQLEAWQRVLVKDNFLSTTHGQLGCISCHKGDPDTYDKTEAHVDLVPYPSEHADTYCVSCHGEQSNTFRTSLHFSQEGYHDMFELRSGFDLRETGTEAMQAGFTQDCGGCHTTCGECHVTRPRSVNSGFISGHVFNRTPNLTNNCTACHGSRVGEEYTGAHPEFETDVHYTFTAGVMKCEDCHSGHELHGDGNQYDNRYDTDNPLLPKCQDCHTYDWSNIYHRMHWEGDAGATLSCQVCHSQPYKNCNGCHAKGTAASGGITGSSYLLFKIGKNPLKSEGRPYDYVPVRHIPIVPNTFKNWGLDNLENFTAVPTWKYATPHNIQRWTAQTDTSGGKSCGAACHDNDEYYLREADLILGVSDVTDDGATLNPDLAPFQEAEAEANKNVIIP